MSLNADEELGYGVAKPTGNLELLAPAFRRAVERAIAECRAAGLPAVVFETYRSNALQVEYYARGRTQRPPDQTVTNAPSNTRSWHGYGLAVDVIHETRRWAVEEAWFVSVAEVFKRNGCKWGGDWVQRDLPHFQWGLCRPSPSDRAQELLRTGGIRAVWDALQAGT